MRPYCYLPAGSTLVETCTRTIQGRRLLKPGLQANEIMLGVLGRALDYYPVDLFGFSFQSNHYHLHIGAEPAQQMAKFQGYFNSNLARKMCKFRDWSDKLWARRYRPMAVSDEPQAQLARLEYLLANGTKEGLVASPLDWPGPNMARALTIGEPLVGYWFNQTKEWRARRRGENFEKYDYATRYEITLQRLPAFRDLSANEYKDLVTNLVEKIEMEAAEQRGGRPVLGRERILTMDPYERPRETKKSPASILFFARSKQLLKEMRSEYREFANRYQEAADRLLLAQKGNGKFDPRSEFSEGCFPPALQFVGKPPRIRPSSPPSRTLKYGKKSRILERGEVPVVRIPQAVDAGSATGSSLCGLYRCNDPPVRADIE